jgi:hypothetical protein
MFGVFDLVSGADLLRKHAAIKLLICDATLLQGPGNVPNARGELPPEFFSRRVLLIQRSKAMDTYVQRHAFEISWPADGCRHHANVTRSFLAFLNECP